VTDPAPPSALRELRDHLRRPPVLAGQAGVALVAGLSGPFGTFEAFGLPLRLAYWAMVVFGTYALGTAVTLALEPRLAARPAWQAVAALGLAVGAAVVLFLAAVNLPVRGWWGWAGLFDPLSVAAAFVVSWVVLGVRVLWSREAAPPSAPVRPGPPRILSRLPLDRRGALVCLSVQDHYVEIVTTRGRDLVLMRLSDAIAEAEGVEGLQVHRSHWVALAQVQAARRQGDGAVLTLSDGREVPVARARLGALRAAGLLPK
jgi:hypothetical protein